MLLLGREVRSRYGFCGLLRASGGRLFALAGFLVGFVLLGVELGPLAVVVLHELGYLVLEVDLLQFGQSALVALQHVLVDVRHVQVRQTPSLPHYNIIAANSAVAGRAAAVVLGGG